MSKTPAHIGVIGTLGPEGTDSQKATEYYLQHILKTKGAVKLFDTLEEGIGALVKNQTNYYIAPSICQKLDSLFFRFIDKIEICDSFVADTHDFVLARNPRVKHEYASIASPASNIALIEHEPSIPRDITPVFANNKSQSARICGTGRTDLAITNLRSAKIHNLEIIKNYGKIKMSWTVFQTKGKK